MTLSHLLSWAKKGSFTTLDQGLFAGANFLINILLARWLEPAQYGAFAVVYSVFLLLASFHTAVLTEPMLVFGAGKYEQRFREYLGILFYGHWRITGVLALVLALATPLFGYFGSQALTQALAGLVVASPFILFLWLVRRACYVLSQPQWAMTGSALYLVLMLMGMCGFYWKLWLSVSWVLVILGIVSFLVSLWLSTLLHAQWRLAGASPILGMVLADHYQYGRWSLIAAFLCWLSGEILSILVPVLLGLDAGARMSAVGNLFKPLSLFTSSLSQLILPYISSLVHHGEPKASIKKRLTWIAFIYSGAASVYGLLMVVGGDYIVKYLYNGKYNEPGLVVLLGFFHTASVITTVFSIGIMATGSTRVVSQIWSISALFVTFGAIPAILLGKLYGALTILILSYLVATLAAWRRL